MPGWVEAERLEIANEVVWLAAGGEDRPHPARCDHGDVAADGISPVNPNHLSSKSDCRVPRAKRPADGKIHVGAFTATDAASDRIGIDEARPDRGRMP